MDSTVITLNTIVEDQWLLLLLLYYLKPRELYKFLVVNKVIYNNIINNNNIWGLLFYLHFNNNSNSLSNKNDNLIRKIFRPINEEAVGWKVLVWQENNSNINNIVNATCRGDELWLEGVIIDYRLTRYYENEYLIQYTNTANEILDVWEPEHRRNTQTNYPGYWRFEYISSPDNKKEEQIQSIINRDILSSKDIIQTFNTVSNDSTSTDCNKHWYKEHQRYMLACPTQHRVTINVHTDEVLWTQFSHNGEYLASCSRDGSFTIARVHPSGSIVWYNKYHTGYNLCACFLSWSLNDDKLIIRTEITANDPAFMIADITSFIEIWDTKALITNTNTDDIPPTTTSPSCCNKNDTKEVVFVKAIPVTPNFCFCGWISNELLLLSTNAFYDGFGYNYNQSFDILNLKTLDWVGIGFDLNFHLNNSYNNSVDNNSVDSNGSHGSNSSNNNDYDGINDSETINKVITGKEGFLQQAAHLRTLPLARGPVYLADILTIDSIPIDLAPKTPSKAVTFAGSDTLPPILANLPHDTTTPGAPANCWDNQIFVYLLGSHVPHFNILALLPLKYALFNNDDNHNWDVSNINYRYFPHINLHGAGVSVEVSPNTASNKYIFVNVRGAINATAYSHSYNPYSSNRNHGELPDISQELELRMYNPINLQCLRIFKGHYAFSLKLSPFFIGSSTIVLNNNIDNSEDIILASGSESGEITVWSYDHSTNNAMKIFAIHSEHAGSVHFNPIVPGMLASASDDHSINIFSNTCTPFTEAQIITCPVSASPNNTTTTNSDDNNIIIDNAVSNVNSLLL